MPEVWVAVAVLPLVFFLVVVMECSRLHCARVVQRRLAAPGRQADVDEATILQEFSEGNLPCVGV